MSDNYTIRINQFTDGPTGHTNITFISSDGASVTYGNNVSPSSGVQDETQNTTRRIADHPGTYSYVDLTVSAAQFSSALAVAQAADMLNNSYFGLCNNCADFANELLKSAGFGDWALKNYVRDDTLVDTYAKAAEFICGNEYVNRATSAILDILASPTNVADAVAFVDAMSWLSHPTNSDFYNQYVDPDSEAHSRLAQLKLAAVKLSISVNVDPIEEKVWLGVASPIMIDLNGDGIRTTSYASGSIAFDIDGDGKADRTAWASKDDGFLAIDSNDNGKIDGVDELFGGMNRGDGYAKLAELDSNGDGLVTASDSAFGQLRVWQDANGNGLTDQGELRSAEAVGVESLALSYVSQDTRDENGNLIGEVSSAVLNGHTTALADIYFRFSHGTVPLPSEASRPTLPASIADVHRLVEAMASFSPPAAGECRESMSRAPKLDMLIAAVNV
jgi:hypothetical protein